MTGRSLVRALLALLALLALTLLSWALAHVRLGAFSGPVAFVIAAAKALVVAFAFMEVRHASVTAKITALVVVLFIALLCSGAVTDILLR